MAQNNQSNINYSGLQGQSTYQVPQYSGFQPNTVANTYQGNLWAANNPYNTQRTESYIQQPVNNNQQTVNSQRIWVQGEGSAKAYIVANNTEQVLWDAEQPVIYIKTVDGTGKPSTITLDYTIRNPEPENINKETEALKSEIAELKDMMKQMMSQQRTYKPYNKKGGED